MDSISEIKKKLREVTAQEDYYFLSFYLQGEDIAELRQRIPTPVTIGKNETKGLLIHSDCISLALIFGEYEAADRIIDELLNINMCIDRGTTVSDLVGSSITIPFAGIFYSEKTDIPEWLRIKILKKLDEDMFCGGTCDGGLIDINSIRDIEKRSVQAKIVNDHQKHPEYFDYRDSPRTVEEIPAAYFLMKLYKNDPVKLECLMSERLEMLEKGYAVRFDRDVKKDFERLKKAFSFSWMTDHRAALYALLVNMYTGIKKVLNEDISFIFELNEEVKVWQRMKAEIADFILRLQLSETEFNKSLDINRKTGIEAAINCLSFGKAILGNKPEFVISSPSSCIPETFFGFGTEDYEKDDNALIDEASETNMKMCRMLRLAENIGRIRYRVHDDIQLDKKIASFLILNAKLMKDSFLLFAEKGLVPDDYIDFVIKRINPAESCRYMVPVLIMQKYGRIHMYE